jgi:hypothetical protein
MFEDFYLTRKGSEIGISDHTTTDVAYERRRCRSILRDHARKAKWRRLIAIDLVFGGMKNGNLPPLLLKELIAPHFFSNFPHGRILYVPVSKLRSIELMKLDIELGMKYLPEFDGLVPPHAGSSLDMELSLRSIGVDLALHFAFPYLMGINAPLAFGNLVFQSGVPVLTYDRDTFVAQDIFSLRLSGVYTDQFTPSRGVKRPILVSASEEAPFSSADYYSYIEWYINRIPKLYDFILAQSDKDDAYLAALSVSRIVFETYLNILSEIPLIRLLLTFSTMDKLANLAYELGYSTQNESDTWLALLSPDFLARCSTILDHIPGLGHHFSMLNKWMREDLLGITNERRLQNLRRDLNASKLMRIYRNSHHGYLLRDDLVRKTLLSHSGDIFNEFPDIVFLFWNAFLTDPPAFLTN